MPRGAKCWVEWPRDAAVHMMTNKLPEIVKPTHDIHCETGTHESLRSLQSQGFWNSCQRGVTDWDTLTKAGFVLDFVPTANGKVESVTFQLDETLGLRLCKERGPCEIMPCPAPAPRQQSFDGQASGRQLLASGVQLGRRRRRLLVSTGQPRCFSVINNWPICCAGHACPGRTRQSQTTILQGT